MAIARQARRCVRLPNPPSSVVSNGFRRASGQCLLGGFQLVGCERLLVGHAESDVIVATKCGRRGLPAHVAIDACSIHLERSRQSSHRAPPPGRFADGRKGGNPVANEFHRDCRAQTPNHFNATAASPRKKKKPATSVTVVRKMLEASAGSSRIDFKPSGIITPASAAAS